MSPGKEGLHQQRLGACAEYSRQGAVQLRTTADHHRLHLDAESRRGLLRFLEEEPVGGIPPMEQEGHPG
jgi:hypothetical protein